MKKLILLTTANVLVLMLSAGSVFAANTVTIDQVGSFNTAFITQINGTYKSSAGIEQKGKHHRAVIKQNGDSDSATINQKGKYHKAVIKQNGDSDSATIEQKGRHHRAVIKQNGDSDFATIEQKGKSNIAKVIQLGFSNIASVSQQGRKNFAFIRQQSSLSKDVIVTQKGVGNSVTINH